MARQPQPQKLLVEGDKTYVANGQMRVRLSQLQPIRGIRGGVTYAQKIRVPVNAVLDKSDAGNITLEESHSLSVIDRILLRVPGWRDPVIDLTTQAGAKLHAFTHAVTGARGHGAGDTTIVASTQTAYYRYLDIEFRFLNSKSPSDGEIPIVFLQNAVLEIWWANGAAAALYPSTTSIHSTAEVPHAICYKIERDEFIIPVRSQLRNMEVPSNEAELPFAGRTLRALLEVPEHTATGLTDNLITGAERVLISLTGDGRQFRDSIDADDLIEEWNRSFALRSDRSDKLTAHASAGAPFVPSFMPGATPYAATHLPHFRTDPTYKTTGTDGSPHIVYQTSTPIRPEDVVAMLRAAGARVPGGPAQNWLFLKTPEGRVPWPKGMRATRLPVGVRAA